VQAAGKETMGWKLAREKALVRLVVERKRRRVVERDVGSRIVAVL